MNIQTAIDKLYEHETIAKRTINLVPSENYASVLSRIPLILDMYNRYYFDPVDPDEPWSFRGIQNVVDLETKLAIPLLKEMTEARFVNVRPLSGMNAMMVALRALGGRNTEILTVSPAQGGHYATKSLAETLGYKVYYLAAHDEFSLDYDSIAQQLNSLNIKLIYVDQSNGLFPFDIEKLVEVVKRCSPKTLIHVDVSHWLGLVLGKAIPNPLSQGANSIGGSTHKTFPGPQKGILCTNNQLIALRFANASHSMISNHHFGSVASLGLALLEFKEYGKEYCKQMITNAKTFATLLDQQGFDVKGKSLGYTSGHQIWLDPRPLGMSCAEVSDRLYDIGIRINVLKELPGSHTPMIRLGVNEMTRLGAELKHIPYLVTIMMDAIQGRFTSEKLLARVEELRKDWEKTYSFSPIEEKTTNKIRELVSRLFNEREI